MNQSSDCERLERKYAKLLQQGRDKESALEDFGLNEGIDSKQWAELRLLRLKHAVEKDKLLLEKFLYKCKLPSDPSDREKMITLLHNLRQEYAVEWQLEFDIGFLCKRLKKAL